MKILIFKQLLISLIFAVFVASCSENDTSDQAKLTQESIQKQNEQEFLETLKTHLQAVSDKNLSSLKSTMSPEGKMQLILPGSEIQKSVDSFMNYHENWFQDTSWTFETKILDTEIGNRIGLAITEIIYREPERNGAPYYNRMIVSYGLEKLKGKWYVITDHASSIEKSTDKK